MITKRAIIWEADQFDPPIWDCDQWTEEDLDALYQAKTTEANND